MCQVQACHIGSLLESQYSSRVGSIVQQQHRILMVSNLDVSKQGVFVVNFSMLMSNIVLLIFYYLALLN